eukprot:5868634-Karenia_brevis.AAC.1
MAWREAEAGAQQGVKHLPGDAAPVHNDDPLLPEVEQGLRSSFAARHTLTIPLAWKGVPSLVEHLRRELHSRNMVLLLLHKLKSTDSATLP